MRDLNTNRCVTQTSGTGTACRPRRLTAIVTGLLLTLLPLLSGCGSGGGGGVEGHPGSAPLVTVTGATASLTWDAVPDASVIGYFVHYGRVSPSVAGSCTYESSVHVTSPSAMVTNLDPNTHYYFAVSAYNGLESACSSEVSTVTA